MSRRRFINNILTVAIISAMMGGWLAYAQQYTETEKTEIQLFGHDCGTGGKDHRIGSKLEVFGSAEYEAETQECKRPDSSCEGSYAAQDGILHPICDNGGECLGSFKVTAYTAGFESCGKHPDNPLYGITATGTRVAEHHTIASDWDVLPPGTKVRIEGFPYTYIVEDRGGAVKGKHIDIYMQELDEALAWGVKHREVYLIGE